jgi:hypothetical protein
MEFLIIVLIICVGNSIDFGGTTLIYVWVLLISVVVGYKCVIWLLWELICWDCLICSKYSWLCLSTSLAMISSWTHMSSFTMRKLTWILERHVSFREDNTIFHSFLFFLWLSQLIRYFLKSNCQLSILITHSLFISFYVFKFFFKLIFLLITLSLFDILWCTNFSLIDIKLLYDLLKLVF